MMRVTSSVVFVNKWVSLRADAEGQIFLDREHAYDVLICAATRSDWINSVFACGPGSNGIAGNQCDPTGLSQYGCQSWGGTSRPCADTEQFLYRFRRGTAFRRAACRPFRAQAFGGRRPDYLRGWQCGMRASAHFGPADSGSDHSGPGRLCRVRAGAGDST